jgi:hypothetical protein
VRHESTHAERGSARRRIARSLPAALLIVVALHQIVRAHTGPLSAWRGGGFGMFSTIDHLAARYVRCYLVGSRGEKSVPVPPRLLAQELTALGLPTERNLRALAAAIAATAPPGVRDVTAVRVEYWVREFDAASATLSVRQEQEVRIDLARPRD